MKPSVVVAALALVAAPAFAQKQPARRPATPKPAAAAPRPAAVSLTPAVISNPVVAGDFPDPSITKVGDAYWATATTSNWGPVFPLLTSKNLVDWQLVGHVFPEQRPAWADYYFWAPEISQDGGRTYVFYTAHKKGGNLCVGVASADKPAGPYRDHGPLVGQPDGSIDGFPVRAENGKLYLLWKEDGNSVQQPTPIWAQELNAARTALVGEKKELLRNDPASWEGNLVEGPSVVRHGGYFYLFYAGNGCCGAGCTYATGVARAQNLLGPWEKYAQNPILTKNDAWTCPGHGTAVEKDGRWFMLHHAYQTGSFENVGRQGVLSEFVWNAAGWPEFLQHGTPTAPPAPAVRAAQLGARDEFDGGRLGAAWQWPVEDRPTFTLSGGRLHLQAQPGPGGAALGRPTTAAGYAATTTLLAPAALPAGSAAGLAALGDPANSLALVAQEGQLNLVQTKAGKPETLAAVPLAGAAAVQLRYRVQGGNQYRFAWSTDGGQAWHPLPADGTAVDGRFLPPWDRGVRAGVVAQGPATTTAVFERFEVSSQP